MGRSRAKLSPIRIVTVALLASASFVSPGFAHGHHFSGLGGGIPQPNAPTFESNTVRSPHELERPELQDKQNPYDKMSCQQLFMLATQSQNADLANAMDDKNCGAL